MAGYNFKKFFNINKIHNDEFVSNGHFIIRRSALTKSQNSFIDTFEKNDSRLESVINIFNQAVAQEYSLDTAEFNPISITEITSDTSGDYQAVIDDEDIAIKDEYYNFFKSIKCRIFKVKDNRIKPLYLYDEEGLVGIVVPVRITQTDKNKAVNYDEYLNLQKDKEDQKKVSKQNSKKCLYISNNKAVVRNKELTCIADLVSDEAYKNLYVESDYKKEGGQVFADFGFVLMYAGYLSHYNVEPDDIKHRVENIKDFSFEDYKKYITDCLNNNQFINVADIKLMELAGESTDYIKTLKDHRQKIINMREQKHKEQEVKREAEDQAYIAEQNKKAEEIINQAEQAIINKQNIKNVEITIYKSRYNSNTTSIILYLMKKYNINVPMKTQGWINQALANIIYDTTYDDYSYRYYKSSADSTVFVRYLHQLICKIKEEYGIITEAS